MENTPEPVNTKLRDFSDKLRILRSEKGVSAREMSLSLGQNVNYINLIENGKRRPSLDMFLYICEYLKVEPDYFFKNEEIDKESDRYFEQIIKSLTLEQKKKLAKFILTMKQ